MIFVGDEGNGGSSAGSSSKKLCCGWIDSLSMLRLRTRSYREGRAFRRGLRPMFINLHVQDVYQLAGLCRAGATGGSAGARYGKIWVRALARKAASSITINLPQPGQE